MIGQSLARYTIESKLGEGGMGVVYKARDPQLGRAVAIKVLPPDLVADPDRTRRFAQEAKAASALNHPHIVTIYDIGSDSGHDFIVMEYVAGTTLDRVIPTAGLHTKQALGFAVEIADALAAAHGAGIVHRDLKPANVMVTDAGSVKVLDFGIAKLVDPAEGSAATRTASLTEAGTTVGTAAYMSPEQAEGRPIDGRSDVFSFGSVLYEMVTGRRAFGGGSRLSTLARILNEEPTPPTHLQASVPLDLEKAILRCLRKDPARRYQTMADLKVALDDIAADSAAGLPAASRTLAAPGRWRWAWAALLPVLAAAAYVARPAPRSAVDAPALHAVPLISLPGVSRSPSFSPDANQVAFTWTGPQGDNTDVYVQQIGAGTPLRLTTDSGVDYSAIWSPDGRSIAFLRRQGDARQHELRLVPPLGGPERKLTEIHARGIFLRDVTLAWCPDSKCLVVTDVAGEGAPDALFVVSLETGEKRQLTFPRHPAIADTDPAISPDGKWLVFRRDASPFTGELYRIALSNDLTATGEPHRLTSTARDAYQPRWLSDSAQILFGANGRLWRLDVSGERPAERLPFVGEDGSQPTVSRPQPDRPPRLAYVRSFNDINIWRIGVPTPGASASAPPVAVISSTRRDATPQFSPDGRRVAFASLRSGDHEIWVADADGANAVQLTTMAANPGFPRWSPDGGSIAFHSNPEGQGEIYVVPAGGGRPRNFTANPAADAFPSFSRDGRWIYFSSHRTGEWLIWKAPTTGGAAMQVSPGVGMLAIESTDGKSLYYTGRAVTDEPAPLWRLALDGGEPVKLLDQVISSSFDVVDGGLYYPERLPGETRLQYFEFASGRATTVARHLGAVSFGLAASPDGRTVLYSRVDSSVNDLMLVENFR